MTKVDRYNFRSKHHGTEVVVKSLEGKWVRASDYDALTADNARLRSELTKAADSLDWADVHLEDAGVVSANVRYGARDARAALNTGEETK
jgi:hypothetical protein